jgi:2-polyprenyl-3-methyl-5-hydroxy-6-metoxy-1,4-benzoquinol methylase
VKLRAGAIPALEQTGPAGNTSLILTPQPASCPLCGGDLDPSRSFSRGERRFARCRSCHAYVTIPLADPTQVEHLYRARYFAEFGDAEADSRRQAMLRKLLDLIPRRPPGRLLDVGCGGGHLLALAGERGWDATGVDPSLDACGYARRIYGLEVQPFVLEKASLPEASFDVVTLVNVLDQAPEPVALLRAARRLLKPGAVLMVRVPNGAFHRVAWSLIRRAPSRLRRSLDSFVIFQDVCLNRGSMTSLMQRAQLTRIRVVAAPLSGSAILGSRGRIARTPWPGPRSIGLSLAEAVLRVLASGARWSPSLLVLGERGED